MPTGSSYSVTPLDEDLLINNNGTQEFFPAQKAGIGYIFVPTETQNNITKIDQPYIIISDAIGNHQVSLRYADVNGKFIDFGSGILGCAYVFPTIVTSGQGVGQNPIGAAMYLSPRLMRGYFAQKYILDDPFNNFPNFKIAHVESNLIVSQLRDQGMQLPEFVYYQGVQGPIKIWSITYPSTETVQQKYLDTDPTKYLSWQL